MKKTIRIKSSVSVRNGGRTAVIRTTTGNVTRTKRINVK